jgi:hypothetical protein
MDVNNFPSFEVLQLNGIFGAGTGPKKNHPITARIIDATQ